MNNKTYRDKRKQYRRWNIVLLSIAIISTFVFLLLSNIFIKNKVIGRFLSDLVLIESKGEIRVDIRQIDYDLFSSDLVLKGFDLSHASESDTLINSKFGISAKSVELDLFNFFELIYAQKIEFRKLSLIKPEITINAEMLAEKAGSDSSSSSTMSTFFKNLLKSGKVRELNIVEGAFRMPDKDQPDYNIIEIKGFDIKIQDFHIENLFNASYKDLFFKSFELDLRNCSYNHKISNSKYQLDNLFLNSDYKLFEITGLKYYMRDTASGKFVEIDLPTVNFDGFILDSILHNLEFEAKQLKISSPQVFINELAGKAKPATIEEKRAILPVKIKLKELVVENAGLIVNSPDDSLSLHDFDITLEELSLDSLHSILKLDKKTLGQIDLHSGCIEYLDKKSENEFTASSISASEKNGEFELRDICYKERINTEERCISSLDVNIPYLLIVDTSLRSKLMDRQIDIDRFIVDKPVVSYRKTGHQNEMQGNSHHLTPGKIDFISWNDLQISDGQFEFENTGEGNEILYSINSSFAIGSASGKLKNAKNKGEMIDLKADELDIMLYDFDYYLKSGDQDIDFKSLKIILQDELLEVKGLEISLISGFDIWVPEVSFSGFRPVDLMNMLTHKLGKIAMESPVIKYSLTHNEKYINTKRNNSAFSLDEYSLEGISIYGGSLELSTGNTSEDNLFSSNIDFLELKAFGFNELLEAEISGKFLDKLKFSLSQVNSSALQIMNTKVDDISFHDCQLLLTSISINDDTNRFSQDDKRNFSANFSIPYLSVNLDNNQENILDSLLIGNINLGRSEFVMDGIPHIEKYTNDHAGKMPAKDYKINISELLSDTISIAYGSDNNDTSLLKTKLLLSSSQLEYDSKDLRNSLLRSYCDGKNSIELFSGEYISSGIKFDYQHIDINASDHQIFIKSDSINLYHSKDSRLLQKAYLPSFVVSGLDLNKYLDENAVYASEIFVRDPVFDIFTGINDNTSKTGKHPPDPEIKGITSIGLERFRIDNAIMNIIMKTDSLTQHSSVNKIDLSIEDFSFNPDRASSFNESMNIGDASLTIPGGSYVISDSLYTISYSNLGLNYSRRMLELDSLVLKPNFDKKDFFDRIGHQSDRMNISVDKIFCKDIDFQKLFNGELDINELILDHFTLHGYRDKAYPFPEDQRRKMPVAMLRTIGMPVNISLLSMRKGHIAYAEHIEGSLYPGEIFLSDFNCLINNISNAPFSDFSGDDAMSASVTAYLMGQGFLDATIKFPLKYEQDTFQLKARMDEMDLTYFSDMTRNLFGVDIKKGTGSVDTLLIRANNDYSTGRMYMPYRKLKISLYNRHKGKKRGLGSSILSFLANELIIKSNNPKPIFGRKRIGEVFALRDKRKSYFNYIWISTLSGLESTMGFENKQEREHDRELRNMK